MAEVRFLDGPLRGQIRDVPEWPDGQPKIVHHPRPVTATGFGGVVVYRMKPSYYAGGPRWVAAATEHCGDPVAVVVPFARELRDLGAAFGELIEGSARAELARACSAQDLVAVEVRELFRGSLVKARRLATTRNKPLALTAGLLADCHETPGIQVSVWMGIGEVKA